MKKRKGLISSREKRNLGCRHAYDPRRIILKKAPNKEAGTDKGQLLRSEGGHFEGRRY
jgi:hypothetical protein